MVIKNSFFLQEGFKIRKLFSFIFMLGVMLICEQSFAVSQAELKKNFDDVFEKILDNPADIDATLEYANIAIEMGDYEAAIPPLERITFFNPALNEIKLKLGIMYFNLGANDVAREYLLDSIKNTDDQEVIDRANDYLLKIKG